MCFTCINWTHVRRCVHNARITEDVDRVYVERRGTVGEIGQRGGQIKATQRNNQCSLRVITLSSVGPIVSRVSHGSGQLRYCALLNGLPYYIIWFGVATGSNGDLASERTLLTRQSYGTSSDSYFLSVVGWDDVYERVMWNFTSSFYVLYSMPLLSIVKLFNKICPIIKKIKCDNTKYSEVNIFFE